jgi:hypothetical protein
VAAFGSAFLFVTGRRTNGLQAPAAGHETISPVETA